MLNELRTLWHNTSGPADFGWPGEEYIPPTFRARRLTPELRRIRQVFLGINPDRFMKNYRLSQMLPIVHRSRLSEWIYALDKRITYEPGEWPVGSLRYRDYVEQRPDRWDVSTASATETLTIIRHDDTAPPDRQGQCWFEWDIFSPDGETLQIRPNHSVELAYEVPLQAQFDGWSQPVLLCPQGQLRCRLQPGQNWTVRLIRRPQLGLGKLLHLLEQQYILDLEALWKGDEPARICREVFHTSPDFGDRLASVLIAFAYRARELPAEETLDGGISAS